MDWSPIKPNGDDTQHLSELSEFLRIQHDRFISMLGIPRSIIDASSESYTNYKGEMNRPRWNTPGG